jgi:hypothetical protein
MPLDTIAAAPGTLMMSMEYDPSGLVWAMLHDNVAVGWSVDDSNKPVPPVPLSIRPLPLPPPKTDPVLSPTWAVRQGLTWFVPSLWRGSSAAQLFTQIATNNGAQRQLYADFADGALLTEWQQWAALNPTLALVQPPQ